MADTPLLDAFNSASDSGVDAPSELVLADLCAAAERAWPGLVVDRALFAGYLGKRAVVTANDDGIAELYLACAIEANIDGAAALFDADYLDLVVPAIAHMGLGRAVIDEIRQQVAEKLLVATDGKPAKLHDYVGQGRLGGLIRVAAVRAAISYVRKNQKHIPVAGNDLGDLPSPDNDPELALMKETYRDAFRSAFEAAVRELSSRERNLLRLHLLDAVTLDKLAEMYSVHRATVTRWLTKARQRVLSSTRRRMADNLDTSSAEFESMMQIIRSRLDVSVQRLLRTYESPVRSRE